MQQGNARCRQNEARLAGFMAEPLLRHEATDYAAAQINGMEGAFADPPLTGLSGQLVLVVEVKRQGARGEINRR